MEILMQLPQNSLTIDYKFSEINEKPKSILAEKWKLSFKRDKMKIIEQQNITSGILKTC